LGAAALAVFIALVWRHLTGPVLFCLFCPVLATVVLFSSGGFSFRGGLPPPGRGARAVQLAAVCLAVGLLGWQMYWRFGQWQREEARQDEVAQCLRRLGVKPGHLCVAWGAHFPYQQLVRPLGNAAGIEGLQLVGLGCGLSTPVPYRRLERFGITDLYQALLFRDNVCLVCHPTQLHLLDVYTRSRYGTTLLVRPLLWHESPSLQLYVFHLKAKPPEGRGQGSSKG
jgi:hypothetical protein